MLSTRVLARLALLPALFAAAATAAAQGSGGRITGLITDRTAGAPISNVSVTIVGTELGARTGADGKYTISDVPPGAKRVRAARIGYAPIEQPITVAAGQTATLNLALWPRRRSRSTRWSSSAMARSGGPTSPVRSPR